MKKYLAALIIMVAVVGVSFIYRANVADNFFADFPEVKGASGAGKDDALLIYLFFSKNDCKSCLDIVETLKELPGDFKIYGVVPGKELKERDQLAKTSGFNFEILNRDDFGNYRPIHSPSLVGVVNRQIYFVIPVTPGTKESIYNLLMGFYYSIGQFIPMKS